MRQFYQSVRVDAESLRFYYQCSICGRMQYGEKLPLLCRGVRALARCAVGKGGMSQRVFNRAKVQAVQQLALQFNQCRYCLRWVCDECYDMDHTDGICCTCTQEHTS
ncbi:MAG: hypothetical protein E7464_06475 [Ruminococcaceae bacterium]|nr:hypothetical protein [Oscillospiraceae bacterium]